MAVARSVIYLVLICKRCSASSNNIAASKVAFVTRFEMRVFGFK